MRLKDWRIKKKMSQQKLALALADFADRYVSMRTVSSWECGVLPRKFWINTITDFTKGKVTVVDLAQ